MSTPAENAAAAMKSLVTFVDILERNNEGRVNDEYFEIRMSDINNVIVRTRSLFAALDALLAEWDAALKDLFESYRGSFNNRLRAEAALEEMRRELDAEREIVRELSRQIDPHAEQAGLGVRNALAQRMDIERHYRDRAEAAEARIAELEQELQGIAETHAANMGWDGATTRADRLEALNAELVEVTDMKVAEMEEFAAEHGLPAFLDHLGLDGFGNEVVELHRAVKQVDRARVLAISCAHAYARDGKDASDWIRIAVVLGSDPDALQDSLRQTKQEEQPKIHTRFIGGTIFCAKVGQRLQLGENHLYGDAFTCPGCNEHIPARDTPHGEHAS